MEIKRLLNNICTNDLEQSKHFYTGLFEFTVDFDSDWFVHLISKGRELELGLILNDHEIVPEQARGKISGGYLTFVVEDVESFYQQAKAKHCEILQVPEMTFYGQKRMLLLAPEGTVCDVSSPN